MKKVLAIFILLLTTSFQFIFGQGCSDPGLCTIGTLNSGTTSETVSPTDFTTADMEELMNASITAEKFKMGVESLYGIGEVHTNIYSLIFRGSVRIKEKMLLNIKVPFTSVQGVLGNTKGVGDITVSMQNIVKSGNNIRIAYTIGMVLPSNNANLTANGNPLPMVYQTSLGFISGLAGITVAYKNWNGVLGFQKNFGRNGNEFTNENLVTDPNVSGFDLLNAQRQLFLTSRHLQDGSDIIMRIERRFQIKKTNFLVGVLPIYRLSNCKVNLLNGSDDQIVGSDGLTFNVTGGVNYTFNKKWRLNMNFGAPVITRKKKPDGLGRVAVFIIGVTRSFW